MSKGENIFKRKDGRWEARYIKGREASGKIKYGFCYGKTYREAKEKVTKAKAAILTGLPFQVATRQRFSYFCDEWLKSRKAKIKPSTYVRYVSIIEKYIKPKLGWAFPLGIASGEIESFSNELLAEGLSEKYVHDILVVVRGVLKYTSGFFPGLFPQIEIVYPNCQKKEMRVLSVDEQKRLTGYLMADLDPCKFGVLFALLTGIRIGELCALRWRNISMEDMTVSICATVQRIRNLDTDAKEKTKLIISVPKSASGNRTIPLTSFAFDLCKAMNPQNPEAYILTGTSDLMEPRTLQYRISKYTKECGLTDVHCHTLRHTFATRAVEADFEIKSLSEILGHASTTITLDRYVHSSMKLKRDNMNKLSASGF